MTHWFHIAILYYYWFHLDPWFFEAWQRILFVASSHSINYEHRTKKSDFPICDEVGHLLAPTASNMVLLYLLWSVVSCLIERSSMTCVGILKSMILSFAADGNGLGGGWQCFCAWCVMLTYGDSISVRVRGVSGVAAVFHAWRSVERDELGLTCGSDEFLSQLHILHAMSKAGFSILDV